jgi:hypothetical protein
MAKANPIGFHFEKHHSGRRLQPPRRNRVKKNIQARANAQERGSLLAPNDFTIGIGRCVEARKLQEDVKKRIYL